MAELNPLPVTPEQRLQIYQVLLGRLTEGRTLTTAEMEVLVYGIYQDTEVEFAPNVQEVFNRLDEINSPVAAKFERAVAGADVARPDPVAQSVQDAIVGGVAGGAAQGAIGAARVGTSILGGAARGIMAAGSSAMELMAGSGGGVAGLVRAILRHPVRNTAIGAGGAVLGPMLFDQNGEISGPPETVEGDLTKAIGSTPSRFTGDINPAPSFTNRDRASNLQSLVDLLNRRRPAVGVPMTEDQIEFLRANEVPEDKIQEIQSQTYIPYEQVNPLAMGFYSFDAKNFPFGATGAGQPAAPAMTSRETQEALEVYRRIQNSGRTRNQPGFLQEDISSGLEELLGRTTGQIRPEGQIMQSAFQEYQGQTLLQHVLDAARQYGVPPAALYGIIALESNFNPNAVGDNGQSFGLVQIYGPAWPNITRTQALNPVFAINWAANNLRRNFGALGSWEAAIMAHNNPVGAREFATTGTIKDKNRRAQLFGYAEVALGHAQASGIGNEIFSMDAMNAGASGPSTAAPDMSAAAINDIKSQIRQMWEAWMGPGAADETYLNQWANWLYYGKKGQDELEQSIKQISTGRWPNKPADITWTEWASPYKSKIQDMLEIPKLDNTDSLLSSALDAQVEGRDLDLMIRKDTRWQRTANYRDQYSQAAIELGRAFGFVA